LIIELDGVVWVEATLRGLIEERDRYKADTLDAHVQITRQAAELAAARIEVARQSVLVRDLKAETRVLRSGIDLERKKAADASRGERAWHGEAVQLKYMLEALQESMKKSPP
jgi:hypothetical protein